MVKHSPKTRSNLGKSHHHQPSSGNIMVSRPWTPRSQASMQTSPGDVAEREVL